MNFRKTTLDFNSVKESLFKVGFLRVLNLTVVHHLNKDFVDYNVMDSAYYIKPVGVSYLHVAVIRVMNQSGQQQLLIKYTQAADDLLYGLRIKFREGTNDLEETLKTICSLAGKSQLLVGGIYYVRQRFNKENRQKAKVRATLIMLKDYWTKFWSYTK